MRRGADRAAGRCLIVPTRYSVTPAGATIERPGSVGKPRHRAQASRGDGAGEIFVHERGVLGDRDRVVIARVPNAEAAAEVDLVDGHAHLALDRGHESDHAVDRGGETVTPEDLRADVQWSPSNLATPSSTIRVTARSARSVDDRQPELRVDGAGLEVLVRVRVDAGVDAHHHRRRRQMFVAHERFDPVELVDGVDHHVLTPTCNAARSSAADLLLPCNTTRSAGKPARNATWSSPPDATSRSSPSSPTRRAIAVQRNALLA